MVFGVKSLSVVEAMLACAATATLMYFGNGLNPVWPLMWVAPLPVLWFASRRGRWSAALVAGIASLAGALTYREYFRVLGLPAVAWLGFFGVAACACQCVPGSDLPAKIVSHRDAGQERCRRSGSGNCERTHRTKRAAALAQVAPQKKAA